MADAAEERPAEVMGTVGRLAEAGRRRDALAGRRLEEREVDRRLDEQHRARV